MSADGNVALLIDRESAAEKFSKLIEQGRSLFRRSVRNQQDLEQPALSTEPGRATQRSF